MYHMQAYAYLPILNMLNYIESLTECLVYSADTGEL